FYAKLHPAASYHIKGKMKAFLFATAIITMLFASCTNGITDKEKMPGAEERLLLPQNRSAVLFNQLKPGSQVSQVDANSDTLIMGKSGTLVFIPANSFVTATGVAVT